MDYSWPGSTAADFSCLLLEFFAFKMSIYVIAASSHVLLHRQFVMQLVDKGSTPTACLPPSLVLAAGSTYYCVPESSTYVGKPRAF
jgi:hypothetical protein